MGAGRGLLDLLAVGGTVIGFELWLTSNWLFRTGGIVFAIICLRIIIRIEISRYLEEQEEEE